MEREFAFLQRCQLGRDLLFTYLTHYSVRTYLPFDAYLPVLRLKFYIQIPSSIIDLRQIWDHITRKISQRRYQSIEDFIADIHPLLNQLKTHQKTFDMKILFDILNVSKPLREIYGLKININGPEQLINIIKEDYIPMSIIRVYQNGQIAGRNATQRMDGLSKLKSVKDERTQPSYQNIAFQKETQRSPFPFTIAHGKYYGVWENPLTQKYIAQAIYHGHHIILGICFDDAIEAAKVVDRAIIRLYGVENIGSNLNFCVQSYLFEPSNLLTRYDSLMSEILLHVPEWKGFYNLNYISPIRLKAMANPTATLQSDPNHPNPVEVSHPMGSDNHLLHTAASSLNQISKSETIVAQLDPPEGRSTLRTSADSTKILSQIDLNQKDLLLNDLSSDLHVTSTIPVIASESKDNFEVPLRSIDDNSSSEQISDSLFLQDSSLVTSHSHQEVSAVMSVLLFPEELSNVKPPTTRKRSGSNGSQTQAVGKKAKVSPPKSSKKSTVSETSSKNDGQDLESSSSEEGFNYLSLLYPTNVLPAKDQHLCQFIGRRFTDLEVKKNDPFKYGCVTDIVQLHGKGPYLFKFYNYFKYPKKPPPDNEEDWAYQGCEELIQDYHKKKNQIYLWM